MADSGKSGTRPSDNPPQDLEKERDELLRTFSGGHRLAVGFVSEYQRLQQRLQDLEAENAGLRAQNETGEAVSQLLAKIQRLEAEKRAAEEVHYEFGAQAREVESEFANLANLFVASNQIHSSLSPRGVTRRIKEVLAQLVGAERYCMYLANAQETHLVPVASEGVASGELNQLAIGVGPVGQVFRTRSAAVNEDRDACEGSLDEPAAVIPLSVDDKTVGVIAIFATLSQKKRFSTIDFELFKLLGQHAAAALVSASLFVQAERRLPGLEAFMDLSV